MQIISNLKIFGSLSDLSIINAFIKGTGTAYVQDNSTDIIVTFSLEVPIEDRDSIIDKTVTALKKKGSFEEGIWVKNFRYLIKLKGQTNA